MPRSNKNARPRHIPRDTKPPCGCSVHDFIDKDPTPTSTELGTVKSATSTPARRGRRLWSLVNLSDSPSYANATRGHLNFKPRTWKVPSLGIILDWGPLGADLFCRRQRHFSQLDADHLLGRCQEKNSVADHGFLLTSGLVEARYARGVADIFIIYKIRFIAIVFYL